MRFFRPKKPGEYVVFSCGLVLDHKGRAYRPLDPIGKPGEQYTGRVWDECGPPPRGQ